MMTFSRNVRGAAALIVAVVALLYWSPVLRAVFGPMGEVVSVVDETFNDGSIAPSQQADISGFTRGVDGWALPPGASGSLTYRFTAPPKLLKTELYFYQPPNSTNRLSVSLDGQQFRTISDNRPYVNERVDLGIGASTEPRPVWVRFEAVNQGANLALIVDNLRISYRTMPMPDLPDRREVFALVTSIGLAGVVLSRRWGLALSTLAILAVGAALRFEAATALVEAVLEPDAFYYRQYGDLMRLFSETGFFSARFHMREPGFVFFIHLYNTIFGSSDFGLRLLTLLLSIGSIYAAIRVGRALFGTIPGQLIGLAMALNGPLIAESVRGLRLELELILVCVYFGLAFLRKWESVLAAAIVLSLLGGFMALTRSTYLSVVLVMNAVALFRIAGGLRGLRESGFRGVREWATGMVVTGVILIACVAPHRYHMYKLTGDAFYDTSLYARWNANMEFAGQPGFPAPGELIQNAFIGPPITYSQYMFGLHSPRQIAGGTVRGYWQIFRRMEVCAAPGWAPGQSACPRIDLTLQILAAIGLVMAVVMPRYLWIPLAFLLFEFPVSFLYDRHLVEPYRHSYSAFPLILVAAVLPFATLWAFVTGRSLSPAAGADEAPRASLSDAEIRQRIASAEPYDQSDLASAALPPPAEKYRGERRGHWDEVARQSDAFRGWGAHYHVRLAEIYSVLVAPGQRVLELGCSRGDLLAAVRPSYGLGVDLSSEMIARARQDHPWLQFRQGDAHDLSSLQEPFDVIILSDLVNDLWDVQTVLQHVRRLSTPRTRVVLNIYSRLWETPLGAVKGLGLARPALYQNWLTLEDTTNLLFLADFEPIRTWQEVLWPLNTPPIDRFANRYLVKLWPFKHLALSNFIVARPLARVDASEPPPTVSVIVPARNEAGNIRNAFTRTPMMGGGTELIFIEGHSSDNTFETIEKEIAAHPHIKSQVHRQTGKGKGDAVRLGFAKATGDILMILDADLTMPPEDLPRFYDAIASGKAEFANGVRLVYPQEKEAMRFFNLIGNKFFSLAFSWLLGQSIKDTLCGTKVLRRTDYERIAANRSYFGDFDPFGDFDLLFGAAKQGLKIVDVPIRYRERTYGETNIHRWSHGMLLLRMVVFAARRVKFI